MGVIIVQFGPLASVLILNHNILIDVA